MTMMAKILTGCAGLAAFATAVPASAQYHYGNTYGNYYANNATQVAANRCAAAVQNRLSTRTNSGLLGILGIGTRTQGRVVSITHVRPRAQTVRVRGLATSNAYGAYGVGAYGMLGSAYAQPDLSFSCTVDYRGYVHDVDINRR